MINAYFLNQIGGGFYFKEINFVLLSIFIVIVSFFSSESFGNELLRPNILNRTFLITTKAKSTHFGTGFIIQIKEKQYLITASHVLCNPDLDLRCSNEIDIKPNTSIIYVFQVIKSVQMFKAISVRRIKIHEYTDIAVLELLNPKKIFELPEIHANFRNSLAKSKVYYLGFPSDTLEEIIKLDSPKQNNGYAIPVVRTGIIFNQNVTVESEQLFSINGKNSIGMSGGPIVFFSNKNEPTIVGVISRFSTTEENPDQFYGVSIDYAMNAIYRNLCDCYAE